MKIDTFANRLNKAMNLRDIKQSTLSEKTNIDKTLINKYLKGIAECGNDKLSNIAKILGVNEVWLMGYDVPMEEESVEKSNINNENKIDGLDILYNKVDNQKMLNDNEKDAIKAVIKNAISRYEESKRN